MQPASTTARGQASLLALVVSLVVLTSVMGVAIALVDSAYQSADREPEERRIATALAERLVSDHSEQTVRANVMNATALHTVRLGRAYPFIEDTEVRIRLGNETVVERGGPTGGATVRRVVFRADSKPVVRSVRGTTTLPGGIHRATITIHSSGTVTTVRANGRVLLYDPSGLAGTFDIPRADGPTRLQIAGGTETVTVRYKRIRTTPTELVVTVDA